MRRVNLSINDALWQAVQREADRRGISAAEYVREAVLSVLAYESGRRGDPEFSAAIRWARKRE